MKKPRKIERHIKSVSPFVKELERAAYAEGFRAGAEAMRNTLAEIIAIKYDDEEIIKVIKKIPLPEMPEPKS